MNPLYLSRVEFEDFRTFGKFALDIPPAPGLTLLVGTNGLGKSSFFDAIEWCLTDQVRRFSNHISRLKECDYLTRRDAPKDAHKVTLQFSDGDPISRTSDSKPDDEALISLLKDSNWGEIRDLGAYLAFTHFLGQAAQQRFTSRKHNEQWEALKGPSGIDRLEEIRTALRGASTANAFRKRAEEEQLRVDQAETALSAWHDSAERLNRLREAGSVIGVVSASELGARLDELFRSFRSLTDTAIDDPGGDFSARMIVVRQAIEAASSQASAERIGLEPLTTLAQRYLSLVPQSDPADQNIAAAKALLIEATAAVTTAALASGNVQRESSAQAAVVTRETEEAKRLSGIRQLYAERERLEAEQRTFQGEQEALSVAISGKQEALTAGTTALANAREAHEKRVALEARQAVLREFAQRAQELPVLENIERERRGAAAAAQANADQARDRLPGLREQIAALDSRLVASDQSLKALRAKATDMADALARIAGHLGEHDEACPVCSTPFSPGVLQSLASAAAAAENGALADQVQTHQYLIEERAAKASEVAVAEETIAAHTAALAFAEAARSAVAQARDNVAQSLEVSPEADLLATVEARLAEITSELAPLLAAEASGEPSIASGQAAVASLEAELGALRTRVSEGEQRLVEATNAILAINDRLNALPEPLPEPASIGALIEAQQQKVLLAQDRQAELAAELAAALAADVAARQRLEAVQADHDRLESSIAAARRDMETLIAQWKAAGLVGTPSEETISARSNALARRGADLNALLENHNQLSALLDGLQKQQELQTLIGSMEAVAGRGAAEDPAEHERKLQKSLGELRDALKLTQATREAVNAYSEQLKSEADEFSSRFLMPLNDMIENFNRALLSTPGETVQFNADHAVNRTQFGMQLRYADEIDNAVHNTQLPPQLVLSEGQMAANGFSILCAASTAYPWSNWRALLLDDPLQHNDIIHAAAFVDVMRNLVELKSYQLIMSSHDRAEGEFLARKFDAAGLPCTVVALTAPSKEGVRSDPPRYNAAARALMQPRLAAAG